MGYPNAQNNPGGAIPVWVVGGGAPVPPGSVIIEYDQITDLSAAVGLTAPADATVALVQINDGIVRYRRDGVAPTGTVGMLAYATGPIMVFNVLTGLKFIQATGSTASLNVEWYGPAS